MAEATACQRSTACTGKDWPKSNFIRKTSSENHSTLLVRCQHLLTFWYTVSPKIHFQANSVQPVRPQHRIMYVYTLSVCMSVCITFKPKSWEPWGQILKDSLFPTICFHQLVFCQATLMPSPQGSPHVSENGKDFVCGKGWNPAHPAHGNFPDFKIFFKNHSQIFRLCNWMKALFLTPWKSPRPQSMISRVISLISSNL